MVLFIFLIWLLFDFRCCLGIMGIVWVLWVFYKRGCEILGISLLVLVAIQRISYMLPTNMSGTKLSFFKSNVLRVYLFFIIELFFLCSTKKPWEKLGKTIIDNQIVTTIFDNSVRKTFFAWELRGKTILDNQWVTTIFDNFVRITFLWFVIN